MPAAAYRCDADAELDSLDVQPLPRRTVEMAKERGARLGVALADAPDGKGVIVSELHSWSELAGLVEVGDKLLSLDDVPLSSAKSAASLLKEAAELSLSVETPRAHDGSFHVDIDKPTRTSDITFERVPGTKQTRMATGPNAGATVVGIAFGGVYSSCSFEVTSPKEAATLLRQAPAGVVTLILAGGSPPDAQEMKLLDLVNLTVGRLSEIEMEI